MARSIFDSLLQVFNLAYKAFGLMYTFFTERIGTLITTYLSWLPFDLDEMLDNILTSAEEFIGADISVITLMFGVGLPIFLILTLVKWILGIVT